jgi:hypothetical protein
MQPIMSTDRMNSQQTLPTKYNFPQLKSHLAVRADDSVRLGNERVASAVKKKKRFVSKSVEPSVDRLTK